VDGARKVCEHALSPALINMGAVRVGCKAATSHILYRFVRKEERK